MTDANHEHDGDPVIHDKRKIDPETGRARGGTSGASPAGADPVGAAAPAAPSAGSPDRPASDGVRPGAESPAGAPLPGGLADLKAENAKLAEELARANASYFNISQEYTGYVRRSKEAALSARQAGSEAVVTALLSVLDDVALARLHGDLEGPFKSVAEKLENVLATNFGLERFGAVGEEFDPTLHEALMDVPSADVTVHSIAQVIQPGYRIGEKVLRPARVGVASPQ